VKSSVVGAISAAAAASIWGGTYVVSKYVLASVPSFVLLWMRYAIAAVILLVIVYAARRRSGRPLRLHLRDYALFAWVGFIGYFVSVGSQFVGTALADAHSGALITSASPAFVFLFARWLFGESLTVRRVTALALSTIGVVVIVGWRSTHSLAFRGDMYLAIAAVTWALLSVSAKIAARKHSSLTATAYAVAFGLLFTTPVAIGQLPHLHAAVLLRPLILLGLLYLAVASTAVAFFLWNKGMELLDASSGSLFFFFQPVVGTVLGWWVLGERLAWNTLYGSILIFVGVWIAMNGPSATTLSPAPAGDFPGELE